MSSQDLVKMDEKGGDCIGLRANGNYEQLFCSATLRCSSCFVNKVTLSITLIDIIYLDSLSYPNSCQTLKQNYSRQTSLFMVFIHNSQ